MSRSVRSIEHEERYCPAVIATSSSSRHVACASLAAKDRGAFRDWTGKKLDYDAGDELIIHIDDHRVDTTMAVCEGCMEMKFELC